MTKEELRVKLATDPNYIFSYIYANNPDAVIDNLRGLGFVLNNVDDVFDAINALHERGDDAELVQAFTVPVLTDQMDPAELAIVQEVMSGQVQAVQGGPQASVKLDATSWAAIAGLGVSLIGILSGKQMQPQNTAAPNQPSQTEKKSNTATYVLIGAVVVIVIVVVAFVVRKKK